MFKMWFLYLMAFLKLCESCPTMTFSRGTAVFYGSAEGCFFNLNGAPEKITPEELRMMRFYGFAYMNCPDCTFGIVSSFDGCDDCVWCLHNEGIKDCKSSVLPIVASALITGILTMFMVIILMKYKPIQKVTNWAGEKAREHRRNKILRTKKKAMKLRAYFPEEENESGPSQESGSSQVKPIYPSIGHYQEVLPEPPSAPEVYQSPPKLPPRPVSSFNKTAAAAGLALIMSNSLAKACDVTSYVSSENKIYTDETYTTLFTGFYHMAESQTLCLKYPDETMDKVVVRETYLTDIYVPIYRTANFTLTVTEPDWECYSSISYRCNSEYCTRWGKYDKWETDTIEPGTVGEFGCIQGNDYCAFCSFYGQCKWYKMVIQPHGSKYTVYKKIKTDWNVKLSYLSKQGNVNNMVLNSGTVVAETQSDSTVSVLAPTMAITHTNDFLMESTEGSQWNVHANNLGDFSSSMIGDLQIGLHSDLEVAYQTASTLCWSSNCRVGCRAPESGLVRGLSQYYNYTVAAEKKGRDRVLKRKEYMTFGLFVTTQSETSILSIPASCNFEVKMTYGCTACNKQTFAVIQATELKSMGLVEIKSNCTLDRSRIACQENPQLIIIDYHSSVCELTIMKTNQTLYISIDYVFEGTVRGLVGVVSTTLSSSAGDMAIQFLSSSSFLSSLGSMVSGITLFGFSLLAIKSVFKYLAVRDSIKTVKDVDSI